MNTMAGTKLISGDEKEAVKPEEDFKTNDEDDLLASVKDIVVILFMLGLWLYSVVLMYR